MSFGFPTLPSASEESGVAPRRGWIVWVLVLVVSSGAGIGWWQSTQRPPGTARPRAAALDDTTARAPTGTRVLVRVVNVSGVQGLARRATMALRDYGFDVVDFGTGKEDVNARTRILVHTGHEDWAARVQRALGTGTVSLDRETLRDVDLTVFVGRDWQPPTESLRP